MEKVKHTFYRIRNYECKKCFRTFDNSQSFNGHKSHCGKERNYDGSGWSKGLTKETDERVRKTSETYRKHIADGTIKIIGTLHTEESKKKLSESMKKAHKEGRAWNIGKSRWNNKQSKPEEIFEKFLNNSGYKRNEDYYVEFPFSIYSADFYFHKIGLVIEIDGCQHERFAEYKERDKRKDEIIKNSGCDVFRIVWRNICYDSKYKFEEIYEILKNKEERKILIDKFSYKQKSLLNILSDKDKEKLNNKRTYSEKCRLKREIKFKGKDEIIKNSNINFKKFGWGKEVAKILGISAKKVTAWMRNNMHDFWVKNCKIKINVKR